MSLVSARQDWWAAYLTTALSKWARCDFGKWPKFSGLLVVCASLGGSRPIGVPGTQQPLVYCTCRGRGAQLFNPRRFGLCHFHKCLDGPTEHRLSSTSLALANKKGKGSICSLIWTLGLFIGLAQMWCWGYISFPQVKEVKSQRPQNSFLCFRTHNWEMNQMSLSSQFSFYEQRNRGSMSLDDLSKSTG